MTNKKLKQLHQLPTLIAQHESDVARALNKASQGWRLRLSEIALVVGEESTDTRDACQAFTDDAKPLIEVPRTHQFAPVSIAVFDPLAAESVLDGLPFARNTCDRPLHTIAVIAELANGRISAGYLYATQVADFAPAALPADPRDRIDFVPRSRDWTDLESARDTRTAAAAALPWPPRRVA